MYFHQEYPKYESLSFCSLLYPHPSVGISGPLTQPIPLNPSKPLSSILWKYCSILKSSVKLSVWKIPQPCLKGEAPPPPNYFPTSLTSGNCSFSHCHGAQNLDGEFWSSVCTIITCQQWSPPLTWYTTASPTSLRCHLPPFNTSTSLPSITIIYERL